MPVGVNFLGVGLSHGRGDIFFDPVLNVEDARLEISSTGLSYIRSFGLLGRSARVDLLLPYAAGRWDGLLNGEPISLRRRGFSDPRLRLSTLLYGGPAQSPREFAQSTQSSTVVGVALSVTAPWGEYSEQRLINLGANRWVLRPELGVVHNRGHWSYELTGSVFIYEDNDEFFQNGQLETDPLWALQGHLIYTFRPGLWASISSAYGTGSDSRVNGVDKDSEVGNWLLAGSLGVPLSRTQGLKLTLLSSSTQRLTGADMDTVFLSWSMMY